MMEPASAKALAVALYLAPLLVAAGYDLRTYRIPNVVSAALVLMFPLAAFLSPAPVEWLSHLAAGALLFAAGAALFAIRLLGGGDVKLLAATGLWVGMANLVPLVLVVTVAGGVVTLILLGLRTALVSPRLATRASPLPEVLSKGGRVPYALAITSGAALMAPSLPL